ncbi:MAG: hypothetical protein GY806_13310 [Gammaproteobacteria bacterium]|nr:hypothetical protein [Gammaproteobacteria bacterium]
MKINSLLDKFEDFLDLSKHKQKEKHKKLTKIIKKLEGKRESLEEEIVKECKADDTSKRFHDLIKKRKAVSKLLKKARKHDKAVRD